ncbi:MAG: homoserine dehydrogenase [Bacteroidales bacterium]|nr:homoserine dehydrogenase [Bacteroidales bacterium]
MTYEKKLVIGLFGFGVVGEGIYRVLNQTPTLQAAIKRICIKHPDKKRNAPSELFTTDADLLLNDPEINVVVELIDDAEAAWHIVSTSLGSGKAVVSANKKMIAAHLAELLQLQVDNKTSFLYEAAVCGSIPVIRNLEEYYDNDMLNSVTGIINGSTNYILTRMNEDGMAYDDALKLAQELGFAETDPSLDVLGIDAANKLTIILNHAYGIISKPEDIMCKGITQLHPTDSVYAKEKGYSIKLVARANRVNHTDVAAYVLPTFVGPRSQLFNVRFEFNGVIIGTRLADEQFIYGKGAGRYPTSSAVLSDIAALRYGYKYEYKKARTGVDYQISTDHVLRIYVSCENMADIDRRDFLAIEETYISQNRKYITGSISFSKLRNAAWLNNPDNSVIVFADAGPAADHQLEELE